ncbi:unnamed protein product [Vitrella brassicaformis CCMP3155]|uniref:Uncharacterized protein n=1 Tax=Vitrella brassicaformis (strain CCMP3155) TaxID=1169540 RepID=A0A0G4ESH7_VITBC|nr:unnamed protein product [Vitrella brassicaformis CCMP3155]|eukprot:CEM00947.1 unnamed protein product [Vitrella brassicaformis CCMP3155]
MQHHEQQQQHPVSYLCVGRRSRYLLSVKDVVRLRATCTWLRKLFGAAQLRDRLRHSLGSQAGLRRANVNGQQGPWGEMGDVIELAGQCGNCELPVTLSGADINAHTNKTAYVSAPRVLAQLKMVGPHIHFSDGSCLQLFQHGNGEVRTIVDEPGFELQVDPPLPAGDLSRRHRQPHDPPVRSRMYYSTDGWVSSGGLGIAEASVSSFAKLNILSVFTNTHQTNVTTTLLNRAVGGGRLDDLLMQSPHTPVAGCTTTLSRDIYGRWLVLSDGSHPFVALIDIRHLCLGNNIVDVRVVTTEAAACVGGLFKHRFPVTTQLARVALGAVAPFIFDGPVPQQQHQQQHQQQQQQQDDDSDDAAMRVTVWMTAVEVTVSQLRRRAAARPAADRSVKWGW